jgi:hypothetical protein
MCIIGAGDPGSEGAVDLKINSELFVESSIRVSSLGPPSSAAWPPGAIAPGVAGADVTRRSIGARPATPALSVRRLHDQLPRSVDLVISTKINEPSGVVSSRPVPSGALDSLLPPSSHTTQLTSQ